ncbi:hypothetical protein BT69DRAFT_1333594 [Atractiella rhizophila]|nr:hypothetical protein BT69DRAFT_1333594 [Atractiella rhizophila]
MKEDYIQSRSLLEPRMVESEMIQVNPVIELQPDEEVIEQQTFIREPDSRAFIYLITPSQRHFSLQVSILPSFLSRLPASVHTLQTTFDVSRRCSPDNFTKVTQKLSSLDCSNVGEKDGVANLCITASPENVTATFVQPVFVDSTGLSLETPPFTRSFPLQNRSNAIFATVAAYSANRQRFVPVRKGKSSFFPSLYQGPAAIIQVALPVSLEVISCSITHLPLEMLSLIMSFLAFSEDADPMPVLPAIEVCKLWSVVSAPYWDEPVSAREKKTNNKIRHLVASDVVWSPSSGGLLLPPDLRTLTLSKYPPLPSLTLPSSLTRLTLINMCPLPSSISDCPLPPLLEHLAIQLLPYSSYEKRSILPTPLDLSHLTHLTDLYLNGGTDTSNLVSPRLFHTLRNAAKIRHIDVRYCEIDGEGFQDFIRWFFGSRGRNLCLLLFFGDWTDSLIEIGRRTMSKYAMSDTSWIKDYDGKGGVLSGNDVMQHGSILHQASRGSDSIALVNAMVTGRSGISLHLSLLPSFLSRLPSSIHTLDISIWPPQCPGDGYAQMPSILSSCSIQSIENAGESNGRANLYIIFTAGCITASCEVDGWATVTLPRRDAPITSRFALLAEHRSRGIFAPINVHQGVVPVCGDKSARTTIIQVSSTSSRFSPSFVSRLPIERLSLIFDFVTGEGKHVRLEEHPGAGRLWRSLWLESYIGVDMVEEIILDSPNLTQVYMDAFWDEEEAERMLNAIEGLKRLEEVTFGCLGQRKWRKDEVEDFMLRTRGRIKSLNASGVDDLPPSPSSPAASASTSLHCPPGLKDLTLRDYPPLLSLSLPSTLRNLTLSQMCPLPPSISASSLPPLLEHLKLELAPFSPDGKTSVLATPIDFSHLTQLTYLCLDGGDESSNLVSTDFFSTLRNANAIHYIDLRYCMVDSFDFPDFIRWVFGDRLGQNSFLHVLLFFGTWFELEIEVARNTLRECGVEESDGSVKE